MTNHDFLNRECLPLPFCPGCSHTKVLNILDKAMTELHLDPQKTVLVTDIGCIGLSDQWFKTHAVHGLHGRSAAYAQGIKLSNPELMVIVLMGDGGAGIGGHHLISAARRDIDITVIMANNFNFGMTGGEHSVTTPLNVITSSTPRGNRESPFKISETMWLNGASFAARRAFYDSDLLELMKRAIGTQGFSIMEIMEYCSPYFMQMNKMTKKNMEGILIDADLPRMQHQRKKNSLDKKFLQNENQIKLTDKPIKPLILNKKFDNKLSKNLSWIIAGSAGQKIISTSNLFAKAAILSGLFAYQKDDYPVTVQTGYTISFLALSRKPVTFQETVTPDILIITSTDGLKMSLPYIKKMNRNQSIFILSELDEITTRAKVIKMDLTSVLPGIAKTRMLLFILASFLSYNAIFPLHALKKALSISSRKELDKDLQILPKASQNIFSLGNSNFTG